MDELYRRIEENAGPGVTLPQRYVDPYVDLFARLTRKTNAVTQKLRELEEIKASLRKGFEEPRQ